MLNVLIEWLTPIFENMGVSAVDVNTCAASSASWWLRRRPRR